MTQNDVMQLLIGKDLGAVSPSKDKDTYIAAYTDISDGEIAVVNSQNMVLSATSVLTDDLVKQYGIKLIQRSGTELINTDLIKQDNILTYKGKTDAAGAEQITYIGYNGTSGSIEAANSKLYVVRLSLEEQDVTGFGQTMIINSPYHSDADATQVEVANGVALALQRSLVRQSVRPIKPELLSSAAWYATAGFRYAAVTIAGQPYVTCGTDTTYNTGTNTAVAVGDFIRLAATGATATAAVTDGIYKITELTSSTVLKVDRPIEIGATYNAYIGGACVLSAAKVAAANLGIKLTGIARTMSLGKYRYSKVSFKVGLDSSTSFGDTTVTYDTAMSLGSGTYNQIAELEWDLLGNQGDPNRADFLWSAHKADATVGKTYDTLALAYYGDHSTSGIGGTPRRMKQLLVAFETGFLTTEPPDVVIDVMDAYTTMTSGIGV